MTSIHNLSEVDFAAFEADMHEQHEQTFNEWVEEMEQAGKAIDGWRDCDVWMKRHGKYGRIVEVSLDGYVLFVTTYWCEVQHGWTETSYTEYGGDRKALSDQLYLESGYEKQPAWRWNEFTDEWQPAGWATIALYKTQKGFAARFNKS